MMPRCGCPPSPQCLHLPAHVGRHQGHPPWSQHRQAGLHVPPPAPPPLPRRPPHRQSPPLFVPQLVHMFCRYHCCRMPLIYLTHLQDCQADF